MIQMTGSKIGSIDDLKSLRTAPVLDKKQSNLLFDELLVYLKQADWFTVGIMASSTNNAILTLREMEACFGWKAMKVIEKPNDGGPVFLKANQRTGEIYVRIEFGLGEGILISCQHDNENENTNTFGPFPLDFFKLRSEINPEIMT